MIRFVLPFVFAAMLLCSSVSAQRAVSSQQPPKNLKATPEVTAIIGDIVKTLPANDLNGTALGLFRLLSFEMRLDDKKPALETIEKILKLVSSVEEQRQNQIYEGIAEVYAEMERYGDSLKIVQNIEKPDVRSEAMLNLSVRIFNDIENKKIDQPFDLTGLLKQAVSAAAQAKNLGYEALANAFLGRELARQGKKDEALIAFEESRKIAKKLEEVEEQSTVALLIRSEAEAGYIAEAKANIETLSDPAAKQAMTVVLAAAFFKNGKIDEAKALLTSLPAGDARDQAVAAIATANIKILTEDQIKFLAENVSADRKDQFIQSIVATLSRIDKDDLAVKLTSLLKNPQQVQNFLTGKVISGLVNDGKFDEAAKKIDTITDTNEKTNWVRQLAVKKYQKTGDVAALAPIAATYSDEEKKQLQTLSETLQKTTAEADGDEKVQQLFQVLQSEIQLADIEGVKKVITILLPVAEKQTDIAKKIQIFMILTRLQNDLLGDKVGAKTSSVKLMQTLGDVKDIMDLKALVPPKEQENPIASPQGGPAVKLQVPVEKGDVEAQVFNLYVAIAEQLKIAEAVPEYQNAVAKAKSFAQSASEPVQKTDMLLFLAQFLAEEK
ncbi:hypothetical protein FACS189443_2690 [Planctomycetales bacterium]|nr:hypothetical protein FACS189443_2690 [Planctomycetales bacterium]